MLGELIAGVYVRRKRMRDCDASQVTALRTAPAELIGEHDLYSIMGSLEGSAARKTSRLATTERLALARRMKVANDRFVAQVKKRVPDMERQFEHHNAFHDELVAIAASPRLRALIDRVTPHLLECGERALPRQLIGS